ncbi:GGDEF domain-containing phosphodiesterase [Uliginosibacterium sp. H3]|uniref:GGDEF domain-containing phosphodiesterase n=1 Tax=Uliginosibacterium silvisoli TaxID=3114758 RepID=A0ABU6K202_9RHOO|nr:GGDEF domain-containing phosphodiesterase [Uliginosibacterium sp. H3]
MIESTPAVQTTNAADRDGFLQGIDMALRASERQRGGFAVLKVEVGGAAEQAVANVGEAITAIRANVRLNDMVAMLGPREFAVLLAVGSEGGAQRVAGKITESLVAACGGIAAQDVAIGIAIYPTHGTSRDQLLRAADGAQYQARRNRRGIVMATRDETPVDDDEPLSVPMRPDLSKRIGSAVTQNEFLLRYQPVAELGSGRLLSAEALVRWRHPELGLLPPAEFLYLAERDGTIDTLSLKFVEYAMMQARAWRDGGSNLPISVNLPATTLQHPELESALVGRLHSMALPPDSLTIELRDDQLTRLSAAAMKNIFMLANAGVRIAIDDFGRGAASLLALRDLPVHEIKIDPCFIQSVAASRADAAIVASLIGLCRDLGRRVIAKGIETQAVCNRLLELGCEGGQGFHFSKPLEAEALPDWRGQPYG